MDRGLDNFSHVLLPTSGGEGLTLASQNHLCRRFPAALAVELR